MCVRLDVAASADTDIRGDSQAFVVMRARLIL